MQAVLKEQNGDQDLRLQQILEQTGRSRAEREPKWRSTARAEAAAEFKKIGFPSPKLEGWKYTNLNELQRASITPFESTPSLSRPALEGALGFLGNVSIVLINGVVDGLLSSSGGLPDGIELKSLSEINKNGGVSEELLRGILENALSSSQGQKEDQAFTLLNEALFEDALCLVVRKGTAVREPIYITHLAPPTDQAVILSPRVVIAAEANSQIQIVETFLGLGNTPYLTNSVTQIVAGENSNIGYTKLQLETKAAYHIAELQIKLNRQAKFQATTFSFGASITRNEIRPVLDGEGIECHLNGLTVINGSQHVDNHLVIDHAKPNCFSREVYKGIYQDKSSGVFSGTIIVRPDAQKTNAVQSNKSLLLSPDATISTRPQLKIFADDVKCTHGATVGQLDENALFYLRSRGISQAAARGILIRAFADDLLSEIKQESVQSYIETLIADRLNG